MPTEGFRLISSPRKLNRCFLSRIASWMLFTWWTSHWKMLPPRTRGGVVAKAGTLWSHNTNTCSGPPFTEGQDWRLRPGLSTDGHWVHVHEKSGHPYPHIHAYHMVPKRSGVNSRQLWPPVLSTLTAVLSTVLYYVMWPSPGCSERGLFSTIVPFLHKEL